MIPYLRLVRLPNVFTAAADICAGFLVIRSLLSGAGWASLPFLLLASACLYLAGMAFNDIADREQDALTRPTRPLPAGDVSLRGAVCCGVLLLLAGLLCAAAAGWAATPSTPLPLLCAAVLALAVLGYDFLARGLPAGGPLALGFCRALNLLLGMSTAVRFGEHLLDPAVWPTLHAPALALGLYGAALTVFGAQEESGRRTLALMSGWILAGGGLLLAAFSAPHPAIWIPLALLAGALVLRTVLLLRSGSGAEAKRLVLTGVLGICLLDAGLILGHWGWLAWPWALGVGALLLPSLVLARGLAQREA